MIEKFRLRWRNSKDEQIEEYATFEMMLTKYHELKAAGVKAEIGARSTAETEFRGFILKPNTWCGILI